MDVSNHALASIKNLSKCFEHQRVLSNINLSLHQSQLVSILGPNGAGKTTLINTILGRISIDSGDISVFGNMPGSMSAKRQTGAMLQVSGLPDMSTLKAYI